MKILMTRIGLKKNLSSV